MLLARIVVVTIPAAIVTHMKTESLQLALPLVLLQLDTSTAHLFPFRNEAAMDDPLRKSAVVMFADTTVIANEMDICIFPSSPSLINYHHFPFSFFFFKKELRYHFYSLRPLDPERMLFLLLARRLLVVESSFARGPPLAKLLSTTRKAASG